MNIEIPSYDDERVLYIEWIKKLLISIKRSFFILGLFVSCKIAWMIKLYSIID